MIRKYRRVHKRYLHVFAIVFDPVHASLYSGLLSSTFPVPVRKRAEADHTLSVRLNS